MNPSRRPSPPRRSGEPAHRARGRLWIVALLALGGIGFWILTAVSRPQAVFLIERGPIAFLTAGLYGAAGLLAWRNPRPGFPRASVSTALVALGLLELGIGDRLRAIGIAKTGHHDPAITVVLLVVLAAGLAPALLARGRAFTAGLRRGELPAMAAAAGAGLLVVTLVVDHLQKTMRDRGPTGDRYVVGMAEEVFEIVVPALFILALLAARRRG